MLDGSRLSSLVWTGHLELLSFDSAPKIFLHSRVHAGSGQHFLGLTRTLDCSGDTTDLPFPWKRAGGKKNQPEMCSFKTFCVAVHGLLRGVCSGREW